MHDNIPPGRFVGYVLFQGLFCCFSGFYGFYGFIIVNFSYNDFLFFR